MKKDDPKKKKKKLPFYGRAYGGPARARADRKAYRKGGSVSGSPMPGVVRNAGTGVAAKADAEPISPSEPNAPAGGRITQKFKKGGVAKRAGGGSFGPGPNVKIFPPQTYEDYRTRAGDGPKSTRSFLDAAGKGNLASEGYNTGRRVPAAPGAEKRGGAVKRRADGGEIDVPNKPPVMPDKPFEHTGSEETRPSPFGEENSAQKLARGWNTLNRTLGRPLQTGAAGVQRLSDMQRAQSVSDAVPRRPAADTGPEIGIGRRKSGGGVLSAAQRQSLPKSDFALPGKGTGPKGAGSGSYPIPDRSHAANALARSSGKPVAAQVRAKVKAKYPDMGEK